MIRWLALVLLLGCGSWKDAPFPSAPADGEIGRSNLRIPANQTFELGGGQQGGIELAVETYRPRLQTARWPGSATWGPRQRHA